MSSNSNTLEPKANTQATTRLLAFSWLAVAICLAPLEWTKTEKPCSALHGNLLNPNLAPWWELTVLPEIGPALARQIVDYRETQRAGTRAFFPEIVFRSADDLEGVRGIGPKTVARLIPHLRFDNDSLADPPGSIDDHRQPQKEQD